MAKNDGETPGVDDDATQQSDESGEPAGEKTGDKSKKGGKGKDDVTDDDKPKGKFYSDDDINKMIQNRVARATKDAADKAQLSKEQLLEKERDDALNLVRERDLKDDFVNALKIDSAKGMRLFRMFRDEIETDEKGKALNLNDVVKTAKAEFPEFFKPAGRGKADGAEGGGDKGSAAGGDMNSFIRTAAGRRP